MLRIHFLRQWYALADPAMEEALYDSQAMRGFAGIDLAVETVPDETTILNFRHWLERHDLSRSLFDEVSAMLEERGLLMRQSLPRRRPGARSSMPSSRKRGSSPPRLRPKTNRTAATRRRTRRRRATNGTLA
jgi:IS5 family transposase